MKPFQVKDNSLSADATLLEVEGEFDLAVAERVQEAIEEAAETVKLAIVNLSDCEFIDPAGVAVLVRAHSKLLGEGRRMVVCCATDQVERMLELTGLADDPWVFDNLDQVLADFGLSGAQA